MKKECANKYAEFINNNTSFYSWPENNGGEWVVTIHGKNGLNVRYAKVCLLKESKYYALACENKKARETFEN